MEKPPRKSTRGEGSLCVTAVGVTASNNNNTTEKPHNGFSSLINGLPMIHQIKPCLETHAHISPKICLSPNNLFVHYEEVALAQTQMGF